MEDGYSYGNGSDKSVIRIFDKITFKKLTHSGRGKRNALFNYMALPQPYFMARTRLSKTD